MPIFRPEDEARVRELFTALERPVELLVAHGPEETPLPGARDVDFGAETDRIVSELAALSWGYELGSLIGAVLEAGRAQSSLAAESLERLATLDRDLAIDVFVTPT
jgi:alkyl hydroperoxide reductase subunit AhpF